MLYDIYVSYHFFLAVRLGVRCQAGTCDLVTVMMLCCVLFAVLFVRVLISHDDHFTGKLGKPADIGEFDSCQGNVRKFTRNWACLNLCAAIQVL